MYVEAHEAIIKIKAIIHWPANDLRSSNRFEHNKHNTIQNFINYSAVDLKIHMKIAVNPPETGTVTNQAKMMFLQKKVFHRL